ncbi:MAG: STAS domain-containing protein [Gammaproteobacteria bacterium]|nr:STAS domain-containing protein [Gammaproteobacteria bacterium]MBU1446848.1 STAS domain-containing protein [Gammaproteobacteria bacterium]MDD2929327.1 STAS domain-containing protein [Sideroxydans sp.]MDD5470905.1 STAS domain-containing protein [Sideroxydans sp.]MDD5471465.1 STAS domain-containing protein [Sideroxydans sp.]
MIQFESDRMLVTGPLTLETAREAFLTGISAGGSVSIVDLAGVTNVDSSALGVLMQWSRQHAGTLDFINIPESLRSLADLYDVSTMLFTAATDNPTN